eukprot:351304-Chlamydomonas_euryale.AAC.1
MPWSSSGCGVHRGEGGGENPSTPASHSPTSRPARTCNTSTPPHLISQHVHIHLPEQALKQQRLEHGVELSTRARHAPTPATLPHPAPRFHTCLLEHALEQQRLQCGVKLLADILQQHRETELDAVLQAAHVVAVAQLQHLELGLALHALYPLVGLPCVGKKDWVGGWVCTEPGWPPFSIQLAIIECPGVWLATRLELALRLCRDL